MRGWFIVLEGPEGAGKTTQARLLAESLRADGHDVVLTREPGGTRLAERIRDLVLGQDESGEGPMTPEAEALLFTAARAEHVRRLIGPALAEGRVVVCDRFTGSTLAYQGGGRGVDPDALAAAQSLATGGLVPDLTLLLDLAVADGLARRFADGKGEAPNRLDHESVAFHERVRVTYLSLANRQPASWRVIDANRDPLAVAREIGETVRSVCFSTPDARRPGERLAVGTG